MKELRLMSGQQDRGVLTRRCVHVPIGARVLPSVLQQAAASVRAKPSQRDALDLMIRVSLVASVLRQQRADRRPRRLEQYLPMPARRSNRFVGEVCRHQGACCLAVG